MYILINLMGRWYNGSVIFTSNVCFQPKDKIQEHASVVKFVNLKFEKEVHLHSSCTSYDELLAPDGFIA